MQSQFVRISFLWGRRQNPVAGAGRKLTFQGLRSLQRDISLPLPSCGLGCSGNSDFSLASPCPGLRRLNSDLGMSARQTVASQDCMLTRSHVCTLLSWHVNNNMGTFARLKLTGAGIVWEEETSTEKMPLSDWPVGLMDAGDVLSHSRKQAQ